MSGDYYLKNVLDQVLKARKQMICDGGEMMFEAVVNQVELHEVLPVNPTNKRGNT